MIREAPFLSVVVPAFNEAGTIAASLQAIADHLAEGEREWEVIVVDDGSEDATAAEVESRAARDPRMQLVRIPHRGKGAAVRAGMLAARGQWRFLCDADLSMPIEQIERFLPPALADVDIAIGSREAPDSRRIGEPHRRHWSGRAFNLWVRIAAVPDIQDTQCGFKCFRGEVADELFPLQRIEGWAFDVEILFLALRRGRRIVEVPIDWYFREESKVRVLRDAWRMFRDVLRVRWNERRGRYAAHAPIPRRTEAAGESR
jgi:glycosyltransferase involved in cell wall biosynthesis